MSFFFAKRDLITKSKGSLLAGKGCKVCPLNQQPEVPPSGSEEPLIYVLGEAADQIDADKGEPFCGKAGEILDVGLQNLPDSVIRKGNCLWRKPPLDRNPTEFEISCCYPYVKSDIEKTEPFAIFAMGGSALNWLMDDDGEKSIMLWRGRRFAAKIGDHVCWVFPMLDPSYLLHNKQNPKQYDTVFQKDIDRAVEFIKQDRDPVFHDRKDIDKVINETFYFYGDEGVDAVEKSLMEICRGEDVGFDLETNGLSPLKEEAKILSMSFSSSKGDVALSWSHKESKWSGAELEDLSVIVFEALESVNSVIPHNLDFELKWMVHFFGWDYTDNVIWEDTQAQAFILDERRGGHNLDMLVRLYFGFFLKNQSDIDVENLDDESLEDVLSYNVLDSHYTHLLFHELNRELKEEGTHHVYMEQIYRTLSAVGMSLIGMPYSAQNAAELYKDYQQRLEETVSHILQNDASVQYEQHYGIKFDPDSPTEVGKLLTQVCGLDLPKNPQTGHTITKDEVLSSYNKPLVQDILDHRRFSKVLSTYLKPLQESGKFVFPDQKLHPKINVNLARTGRLSVDNPPLHQLPRRKDREVRRIVSVHSDKDWLVAFDYGGIEARVLAMVSQDEMLVRAFNDRYDIHADWAERIFSTGKSKLGHPSELKDPIKFKELRYYAKTHWVFAMFYGSKWEACSYSLMLPLNVGKELNDEFWSMFSGVGEWQKQSHESYLEEGRIVSLTGRIRHGPVERYNTPLNTQIQSVAGDILQDAMNKICDKAREEEKWWLHPIMQVHDELLFLCPYKHLDELFDDVPRIMLTPKFDFINVPLVVKPEIGKNWCDMQDFDEIWSTEYTNSKIE